MHKHRQKLTMGGGLTPPGRQKRSMRWFDAHRRTRITPR